MALLKERSFLLRRGLILLDDDQLFGQVKTDMTPRFPTRLIRDGIPRRWRPSCVSCSSNIYITGASRIPKSASPIAWCCAGSAACTGGRDRGWAVWAREEGTRCGSHHRPTDVARSHHLVSGHQLTCPNRRHGKRTPIPSSQSGRGDQALRAAHLGRAELQTRQTCARLVAVPGAQRPVRPAPLAVGLLRLLLLLVSWQPSLIQHGGRTAEVT
jgi:hypothetical protein